MMGHRNDDGFANIYQKKSVMLLSTRYIIQAIGRICRTNQKNRNIYVYADDSIADCLDVSVVEGRTFNSEVVKFFKQPHCIEMTNRLFLKQEVAEMANEDKKDFNAMLHDNKDMPKFQIITDQKSIEKYGGSKMYFAPPIDYDKVMKKIPYGKVITVGKIREYFAELSSADFTEPITAGIFVSIVAWASYQRSEDETPYWRTLKANGELNAKYPNGIEAQKEKLEAEGHTIIQKGRKNVRYYVKDYENSLFDLK